MIVDVREQIGLCILQPDLGWNSQAERVRGQEASLAVEAETGFIHEGRTDRPHVGGLAGIIRRVVVIAGHRTIPLRVHWRVGIPHGDRRGQAVLTVEVVVDAAEDARRRIRSRHYVVVVAVDAVGGGLIGLREILEEVLGDRIDPIRGNDVVRREGETAHLAVDRGLRGRIEDLSLIHRVAGAWIDDVVAVRIRHTAWGCRSHQAASTASDRTGRWAC